jgi:hypothetical protein
LVRFKKLSRAVSEFECLDQVLVTLATLTEIRQLERVKKLLASFLDGPKADAL